LAGSADISPFSLRVIMIFRREEDTWRVVHRHADRIMTSRKASAVIET